MDKICIDILNKWAKYTKYDANKKSYTYSVGEQFNLRNFEYETNKLTKRLTYVTDNYDETGLMAVEMAKNTLINIFKESRLSVYEAICNYDEMQPHIDMYKAFCSEEIKEAEDNFVNNLNTLISQLMGKKLIGESAQDKETVFGYISEIIQALDDCNVEFYKNGGQIGEINKVSKSIHIFPTLAECILTLNNAEDGLYLCFIDILHTADSYFGFFIKNNGNLFSINDRVDEAFKSQHCHSRNGRWTESKSMIFPYNYLFSFDNYDYKGYANSYIIDNENLSIFNMEERAYMPILIAMILLIRKYKGQTIDQAPVYIDLLLPVNKGLLEGKRNELMLTDSNEIINFHNQVNIDFDVDKILDGSVFDEFNKDKLNYNEYINTENKGQIFVDLYGKGFKYTPDILSSDKMLTKSDEGEYIPEFIGSETRLRAQALMEIRLQLADYIRSNMYKEYINFGEITAVKNWFKNIIRTNMDKIEDIIVKLHFETIKQMNEYNETHSEPRIYRNFYANRGWQPNECNDGYYLSYEEGKDLPYEYGNVYYINDKKECKWEYIDQRTGATCSIFYIIRPINYKGLENLFGEIPKIVKGWNERGHRTSCNSLLDMYDPVEKIGTPFEYDVSTYEEPYKSKERTHFEFSFTIGYSKRGFNQMLKEHTERK